MVALIWGGSGSGKSHYAEQVAHRWHDGGPKLYLATMGRTEQAQERIARHQRARAGCGFQTLEEEVPHWGMKLPSGGTILLEDLENWVANQWCGGDTMDWDRLHHQVMQGIAWLTQHSRHLVVVGNDFHRWGEVCSREIQCYQQLLGRLHQTLASRGDLMVEVVCGLPLSWKGVAPV